MINETQWVQRYAVINRGGSRVTTSTARICNGLNDRSADRNVQGGTYLTGLAQDKW